MLGLIFSIGRIPLMLVGGAAGFCMLCACARYWSCCRCCSLRRCCGGCCKRWLRCVGWDKFDDFDLMLYVHEASFEKTQAKMATKVRIVAGDETAETDSNSKGIYQQSFEIKVDQGTEHIRFDLLCGKRVLADMQLDVLTDVLGKHCKVSDETYLMKAKKKVIAHPKLKITMAPVMSDDADTGLRVTFHLQHQLGQVTGEQQFLLRQQLQKAQVEADQKGVTLSTEEVLKQACSGPLEIFESLGRSRPCFAAVLGPPRSRRWALGVWNDEKDYEAKKPMIKDIDILKIMAVQADPGRGNVFLVQYADGNRRQTTLTFRRVDRARDTWVEMLKLVIKRAHEVHLANKKDRTDNSPGSPRGSVESSGSKSGSKKGSKKK